MQKIVVFTSPGGGGHVSASNALSSYLKDSYEVCPIFLLEHVLKPFDPLTYMTMGKKTGEQAYNTLMKYKQWWLINLIYYIGRIYFKPFERFMRNKIIQYLRDQNADMVISVIPIFNNVILQAAKELDIPFLLIPTDLDIRSFCYNLKNNYYKKFHLSLIFNDHVIKQQAKSMGIKDHQISFNGFPLREEFFELKNPNQLRISMEIEPEVPVIMIMMGMQGAQSIISCVNQLKRVQIPIHLLVCIGKNSSLKDPLRSIPLPPWVTMHIIQETNRISDYMSVSDVIISKSGSASFCEAIHMKIPMVLDGTSSTLLIWEKYNHEFTQNNNLGTVIKNYDEIPYIIEQFFSQEKITREMRTNAQKFACHSIKERIKTRVASMLSPAYLHDNSMLIAIHKKY
jgi:processive 1,2-diacylglycerol beta-glucosyltransferase